MSLETTKYLYKETALIPDVGLCCTTSPIWKLIGLKRIKKADIGNSTIKTVV